MKIKIKVTKEILEASSMCGTLGAAAPASNCAIALAVRDIFPEARVLYYNIYPWAHIAAIHFPHDMNGFIRAFDLMSPSTRRGLIPFQFEIDVPEAVIETIGLSEVHRILKDSKTLELA